MAFFDDTDLPSWKTQLLKIQLAAPKANKIASTAQLPTRPTEYGDEFHGPLSREETDELLGQTDGSYLVRESRRYRGQRTLCIRYGGKTKNFVLNYDALAKVHYVGENRFDSLHELVQDGLICFHVESNAYEILRNISEKPVEPSPYMYLRNETQRVRQVSRDADYDYALTMEDKGGALDDEDEEEKTHCFKTITFVGFQWCDHCSHFLWGLKSQGKRCQDCGFNAHHNCATKVPDKCQPRLKFLRNVFGSDLSLLCRAHDAQIPPVVVKCVEEIERRGLFEEGLYRTAGFKEQVDSLRVVFDKEKDVTRINLGPKTCPDINTVASLLKHYFRLLPVPLLTFTVLEELVKIYGASKVSEGERLVMASRAVRRLPLAHYHTLAYFVRHLRKVLECEPKNKMNIEALSTCLAPTLMSASEDANPLVRLQNVSKYTTILKDILHHGDDWFGQERLPSHSGPLSSLRISTASSAC